ncbi:hypothetical protein PFLUV_G00219090 [Perca fluviatilis]|uniref:Uncharacterized protein n=1 Tax=Perca fluviatilis TaxID=8168 RepID=A0A6A5DR84_PERFL|nr:hypothetical protein PFLUV_G00219090 [Perca fluviatilis]
MDGFLNKAGNKGIATVIGKKAGDVVESTVDKVINKAGAKKGAAAGADAGAGEKKGGFGKEDDAAGGKVMGS